jgi:NAD(P)-dependent dehydrogenase (short-subunit alcohol dehydrogenase family)
MVTVWEKISHQEKHNNSHLPYFGQANYSPAKMGLTAFAEALARERAKYNTRSSAIAPVRPSMVFLHLHMPNAYS